MRPNPTFLAFAACAFVSLEAQAPTLKKIPARYTLPSSGVDMYLAYCASCHGATAKGDGAVAADLKVAVPDLTLLAKANQGVFPEVRVAQFIRGELKARAHGVLEMPVWGPIFRSFNDRQNVVVHQRVSNLTNYLGTIQAK
jgi:mono/diheme cytochrome c family protein